MVSGAFMALSSIDTHKTQTVTAATTIPYFNVTGKLPLDLQLDLEKRQTNNEIVPSDTIRDTIVVTKPKRVKVRVPERVTDTLYLPMPIPRPIEGMPVSNQYSGDREEKPPVVQDGPKPSSVILTVDGEVVYSTESVNHSAEKP